MSRPLSCRSLVSAASSVALAAALAGCPGSGGDEEGLLVISPNGGEIWEAGSPQTVLWTGASPALAVDVELSSDGGESWTELAVDAPDTGELDVVAPVIGSRACLVRVSDPMSGRSDVSDALFEIAGPSVRVISPDGGERLTPGTICLVRWEATRVETVRVELSRNGGSSWEEIVASAPASAGSVYWTVDDGGLPLPQADCLVRVSDTGGEAAPDESDGSFMIWEGTWTYPGTIIARPGRIYVVKFADPVDGAVVGTTWQGPEVAGTFLAPMYRPAVVIKADDLRTPIHPTFSRILDFMAARRLPVAAGLVCASLLDATATDIDSLSRLEPVLVEVYHHGYDHSMGDGWAEFSGAGLEWQVEHLTAGIDVALAVVGIDLRTFGAPYNATDADTVAALEQVPQLEVIFYQPYVDGHVTYSRDLNIETDPGLVLDLAEFRTQYAAHATRDILALQCHPTQCDDINFGRLVADLDFLAGEAGRRFTAPTAYARWLVDRGAISLRKVRDTRYELDFRGATYPQVLEFAVEPTSVTEK